ncbi:MAG: S-ribosylhomocysteine lyase [Clostridiales bacterium]|nr:S-ribosylhomocysteine lyase [Clostridiales bacterium]
MEKIESFKIDHLNLYPGVYVSRIDGFDGATATTFDMRFTSPNREEPMHFPAIHTLEHLGATYFRNSKIKDQVIYFGPMGCRTGFYLVLFGKWDSKDIFEDIISMLKFVISFEGEIPGATPIECGNYSEQDLEKAKIYAKKYLYELETYKRLEY